MSSNVNQLAVKENKMRLGTQVVLMLAEAGFEDANKAYKDLLDYCDGLNFRWFDAYSFEWKSKNGVISFVMPVAF
jgi:hypothetical protein